VIVVPGDLGARFLCGKLGKTRRKKSYKRKKRDDIQTAELNHRDQVTAPKSWPSFRGKTGPRSIIERPPCTHRKIAQPRVRMEGWRLRARLECKEFKEERKKQKEKYSRLIPTFYPAGRTASW
jgi:hypothetical protein